VTGMLYVKKNLLKFEKLVSSKLIGTFSMGSIALNTDRFLSTEDGI
jgi:hypothetical protein